MNTAREKYFILRNGAGIYSIVTVTIVFTVIIYHLLTRYNQTIDSKLYDAIQTVLYVSAAGALVGWFVFLRKFKSLRMSKPIASTGDELADTEIDADSSCLAQQSESTANSTDNSSVPYYTFDGEGFNLYSRIGLIIFALIGLALDTVKIVELFGNAATICTWMHTIMNEIFEDVNELYTHEATPNGTEDKHEAHHGHGECFDVGLSHPMRTYLTIGLVEYSLLAAPMLFEMYSHCCRKHNICISTESSKTPQLHKSRRGVAVGLVVITITIVLIVSFFMINSYGHHAPAIYVFYGQRLFLNAISLVLSVLAYKKLRNLSFDKPEEGTFADKLLLISFGGSMVFFGSEILIGVDWLDIQKGIAVLQIAINTVEALQTAIQTLVILDALRRIPSLNAHLVDKPGRSVVAFLLAINFAMWIVDSFEAKRSSIPIDEKDHVLSTVSGAAVIYFSLPIVVFYRFHSTVCLSIIWMRAYNNIV